VRRLVHAAKGKGKLVRAAIFNHLKKSEPGAIGDEEWFRSTLGDGANHRMLAAFQSVLEKSLPVFCVFAETEEPRLFESALPGLYRGRHPGSASVEYTVVAGREHNFTMSGQSEELSESLEAWLEDPLRPWQQ
jgi:hypothetical protein